MADISKVQLPDSDIFNIKDNSQELSDHRHHDSDIVPILHKTYESTGYYASANDYANASWYFMSIKPDDWYKPWRVKFKLHSHCPSYPAYQSYTWSTICGRQGGLIYANWNERGSSAHSYIVAYPLTSTGFNAGYGHAIGISIYNADNRTASAYYRTFEIDYYDCENCTVEILDTPVKWNDWTGKGSTNYGAIAAYDAITRGLQETGDVNSNTIGEYAGTVVAGPGNIPQYSLLMQTQLDPPTFTGLVTTSATATSKVINTCGFIPNGKVLYMSGGTVAAGAKAGQSSVWHSISAMDLRYSFNISTTTFPDGVQGSSVYIKCTFNPEDKKLYLPSSNWWATSLPTTNDGYYYVFVGQLYSRYQATLYSNHPIYYHDGTGIKEYTPQKRQILSQYEYDVLENAGLVDPDTEYFIPDGGGLPDAEDIVYDNTTSGLTATDVQDAIDEIVAGSSDTKVTQTATTDNANYEVLFSGTADNTTRTEGARKTNKLKFNPSIQLLDVTKERIANTVYGVSFDRTSGNAKETILKTGIKWVSSAHMPVVHVTGYAYGLHAPVEFKIGFYIYNNAIGYCGVTNMGAWDPDVYLYKYTRDSEDYVAIGFAGTCYFLQLQADVQDEMGKFGSIELANANWSWEFLTTEGNIPTPDAGVTCIKVPYKANILNPSKVNGHTVAVDVPSGAKFTDTTYTFADGTNGFTVTPAGGTAKTVKVTPSITDNITGSGTTNKVAKFTGTNTIGDGYSVDSTVTSESANLITSGAVYTAINNLPEPMIFKGTLGTGGTITTLPTAASSNEGYTYKVITAGTYASQAAKVGDVFVSAKPEGASAYSWILIPAGDEITSDTWRAIKVNGTQLLGSAISTGDVNFKNGSNVTITGSGNDITIASTDEKVTSSANHYTPATASGEDKSASASGATAAWSIDVVKGVTLNTDGKGHVTGISVTSGKIPANPNTDTKVRQTLKDNTDNTNRPLLLSYSDSATTTANIDNIAYRNNSIYANPSTGTVTATKFVGDISGGTGLTSTQVTNALGYTPPTQDTNTTYSLTQNATDGHKITLTPSTGTAQTITIPDNNTTYTFANGTNGFTVTPSGGTAQTVTVTPSITNNVTGSGTTGSLAKFTGANTIADAEAMADSANTGISIADHATGTITGVQTTTTTASKVTLGTAITVPNVTDVGSASTWAFENITVPVAASSATSIPNVTAAGSGSFTATVTNGVLSFSHVHTAPTLGTAISVTGVSGSTTASHVTGGGNSTAPTLGTAISVPNVTDVSSVTVPIKNTSATTVVTGKSHSVTDNGHTHTVSVST